MMTAVMRYVYQVVIMVLRLYTIVNNSTNKVNTIIKLIKTHLCLAIPLR